jgi:hypothetical protein
MHKINLTVVFGLILSFGQVFADGLDYSTKLTLRSYPLSGYVTGTLGYGHTVWKIEPPKDDTSVNWKYGYVRPVISAETIGIVSRLNGTLFVYPISILGLYAGYEWSYRDYEPSTVNCAQVLCRSQLMRTSVGAKTGYSYRGVFTLLHAKYELLNPLSNKQYFYDEVLGSLGLPGGDKTLTTEVILGTKLSTYWNSGVYFVKQTMIGTQGFQQRVGGFADYRFEDWAYGIAAGMIRGTTIPEGFMLGLQVKWIGKSSIGFF